jgi:hypothetical protein
MPLFQRRLTSDDLEHLVLIFPALPTKDLPNLDKITELFPNLDLEPLPPLVNKLALLPAPLDDGETEGERSEPVAQR